MKIRNIYILIISWVFLGCAKSVILQSDYEPKNTPIAPNYALLKYWAAWPEQKDAADSIPRYCTDKDQQATAKADLFFIHPTIYTQQPQNGAFEWNADLADTDLNKKVDNSTILNQATPFNASCKIYAPRYRQAHIYTFFTKDSLARTQAMELAYEDIKAAFEYYLLHHHQQRPIVIAAHSQGSAHAKRLIKEFFDGKPLQKYLVVAYLVGDITSTPAQYDEFRHIRPAQTPQEVGGFVAWHTYARDFFPENYDKKRFATSVCINPLTWRLNEEYAPKELNKGGVALKFAMKPQLTDAQVHRGLLWVNKPYIAGRAFLNVKNWHRADINFFWQNIRDNVALRLENYLKH